MNTNYFSNQPFRIILISLIILANVGCDQISKNMVRERIHYNQRIDVIDQFLTLTKVENTGAFLGFGSKFHPMVKKVIFTGLPALVLGFAVFLLFTSFNINLTTSLGLGFMIGGGIGNVFDRVLYSSVTDFLHLDFGFASTGIFNMADVSIMIGMGLLMLRYFRDPESETVQKDISDL